MGANISIQTSNLDELKRVLKNLELKKHDRFINRLLRNSSLPIIKGARAKADQEIQNTKTFIINRKGTKYNIYPKTVRNSIGIISKMSKSFTIVIGYRTKSPYMGWFAPYIDQGTKTRNYKGANRGKIQPHNIMEGGKDKIDKVAGKIKKEVEKLIVKLSK